MGVTEREESEKRQKIMVENSPNSTRQESTHPRSRTNSKQTKLKGIQTKALYNQSDKRQRENIESSTREVTHHVQGIFNKINS